MHSRLPRVSRCRARFAAILCILSALTAFTLPTPSKAAVLDNTCVGTEHTTFNPGLLLTERPVFVTVNTTLSCSSSDPTLTGASMTRSTTRSQGCLSLAQTGTGTQTFTWNNGNTSVFDYTYTVTTPLGQTVVTRTGTITSGQFTGSAVVQVVAGASINLTACLSEPGVTSQTNTITVEIV